MRVSAFFHQRNKIIVSIFLLAVIFAVVWRFRTAKAPLPYVMQPVMRETIVQLVSETGHVRAGARTDIYSPATGTVEAMSVKNGDAVTTGQDLFTVRSTATEQEKAQALASYLSAKNTLDTSQATMFSLQSTMFSKWRTFKELAEGDAYESADGSPRYEQRGNPEFHIAEKDWLAAESSYKKQQAVISQAQAALTSSYLLYQATQNSVVKATVVGVIANLRIAAGDTVSAKTAAETPDSPAMLIVSGNRHPMVELTLNEVDILKIRPGQSAAVTVDAIAEKSFRGAVTGVDTVGTEEQGVVTYAVLIDISDPDPAIRAGMTADVDIETDKAENVLAVPNAAIKPHQGKKAVQIIDPQTKKPIYVPVEIGRKSSEKTEIVSGISEGTQVIAGTKNEAVNRSGGGFFGR